MKGKVLLTLSLIEKGTFGTLSASEEVNFGPSYDAYVNLINVKRRQKMTLILKVTFFAICSSKNLSHSIMVNFIP